MKHFNKGNVFGTVITAKASRQKNKNKPEDEGVFLAKIVMDVKSTAHGKVRAYGKIFGDKGKKFLEWYKALKPQDQVIKLDGFYQQYSKEGRYLSNYVFFDWEKRPDETPRAGFILTGELAKTEMEGVEKVYYLHLHRSSSASDPSRFEDEDFKLYVHPKDAKKSPQLVDGYQPGAALQLKGILCQMGDYDYIADELSGEVKPYIKEISICQ